MNDYETPIRPQRPTYYDYTVSIGNAIILFFITFIFGQILSGIILLPAFMYPELNHVLMPISFLLGFGGSALLIMKLKDLAIKELKHFFNLNVSWVHFGLGVLLYLVSLPIAEYLAMLVPTEGNAILEGLYEQFVQSFELVFKYKIAAFLMVCILAPILEELIFRGLILRGLLNHGLNPWFAIIFVGILFGLAHMNPWQFAGAGFLGIVMGYVYWRTQSLILCIFIHFLNNLIAYIMTIQTENMEETIFEPNYYLMGGAVLCTVLVGAFYYNKTKQSSLDKNEEVTP